MKNKHGWLVLDKPKGMSSNFALTKLKKLFAKGTKIGHAGTLDPLAEGVLPVAIGEATKTVQYLMDADKEYEFDVFWGKETETADAEGKVIAEGGIIPTREQIISVIPNFLGRIAQKPPIYSALKINGQPAYKLARKGEEVELKERIIEIKNLELVESSDQVSKFKVECGKGTYVRSIAVDLAKSLGTYGYVTFLKRTRVGNFFIKDAITLAKLINLVHNNDPDLYLAPVDLVLGDILAIELNVEQAKALRNGMSVFLSEYSDMSFSIAKTLYDGVLQAMVSIDRGLCKPLRVFNLNSMEIKDVDY